MFSYGSPPFSSNRFGHNLPASISDPHHQLPGNALHRHLPTLSTPSTTSALSLAKPNLPRDESTAICDRKFLYVKLIFHSSNMPLYSHFLRSLSSAFVVSEDCFSEKWPLKRHSFPRNGVRMSPPGSPLRTVGDFVWFYASWVALQGDTRYGLDRIE